MSLLGNLLNSLTGKESADFTPPCSLCPGSCPIGPEACAECQPYKEKLKDALYNVEHLEEFNARYKVVGSTASGSTTCPHCGAPSGNRFVCDYCGMQIAEDDGKIRVASANDIPDPIIEARELIYERHSTIVSKYNSDSSDRVLSGILDLFSGEGSSGLGERMSKEEITEAAELYGVSISSYLNGLDNGVYQTLAAKKKADSAGTITGYGTAAAVGGLIGHNIGQAPPPKPVNHPMPPQQSRPVRPERRNQQKPGNSDFVRKPRQGGKPQGPHGGPRQK